MDVDNILVKNSYNNLIKIFFIWKFKYYYQNFKKK